MLLWFDPTMVDPRTPGFEQLAAILNEYVLVGIAHIKVNALGTFDNVQTTEPVTTDQAGSVLEPIDASSLPPTAIGVLTSIQAGMQQNIGAFGQAIRWRIYNGTEIQACGNNGLTIAYAGETYDYTAPIPGC